MKVWLRNFFALMVAALAITVKSKQDPLHFAVTVDPASPPPYFAKNELKLSCKLSGSKDETLRIVKYDTDTPLPTMVSNKALVYHIKKLRCRDTGTYVCQRETSDWTEEFIDVPVVGCRPQPCEKDSKKKPQVQSDNSIMFFFCIIMEGELELVKIFFDNDHSKTMSTTEYILDIDNQPDHKLYKDVTVTLLNMTDKQREQSKTVTFKFIPRNQSRKTLYQTRDLPREQNRGDIKDTPSTVNSSATSSVPTTTSPMLTPDTNNGNMTLIGWTTEDIKTSPRTTLAGETTTQQTNTTPGTNLLPNSSNASTASSSSSSLSLSATTTTTTTTTAATTTAAAATTTTTTAAATTTTTAAATTTTETATTLTTTEETTHLPPTPLPGTLIIITSTTSSSSSLLTVPSASQKERQNDDKDSLPYIILGVVLMLVLLIASMLGILVFRYRKLLFSERVRQVLAKEQHSPSQDDDYDDEEEAIYQNADAIRASLDMNKGRYISHQGLIYVTVDHEPRKKKTKTKREKNVIYASLDFDKSGKKTVQELAKHDKSGKHSAQESAKCDKSGKHSVQELAKRAKSGKHSAQESVKRDKSGKHSAQESAKSNKKHRHKHETSKHSQEARPFIHSNHRHEEKMMQRDNGVETPRAHRVHQDHRDNFDERRRKDQTRNIGQSLQIVNEWFENRRPVEHIYANT